MGEYLKRLDTDVVISNAEEQNTALCLLSWYSVLLFITGVRILQYVREAILRKGLLKN